MGVAMPQDYIIEMLLENPRRVTHLFKAVAPPHVARIVREVWIPAHPRLYLEVILYNKQKAHYDIDQNILDDWDIRSTTQRVLQELHDIAIEVEQYLDNPGEGEVFSLALSIPDDTAGRLKAKIKRRYKHGGQLIGWPVWKLP